MTQPTLSSACRLLAALLLAACACGQVPTTDPVYSGPPIGLAPGMLGQHPRLFFDEARLAEIRAFHDSAEGANFRTRLAADVNRFSVSQLRSTLIDSETVSSSLGTHDLPGLALHYLLTGQPASLEKALGTLQFLMNLAHWSGGGEPDCGMPAGNLLAGAAIGYDLLYHHLEPVFREELRQRIWYQARAMYHLGYLMKNKATSSYYWQQDPQNNHRFHRMGGLVTAVLATYTGAPGEDWLLSKTMAELDFLMGWLPRDGSNHEGITYINYGMRQLVLGALTADRVLGTRHLDGGYFKNVPLFVMMASTPDLYSRLFYADDGSSLAALNNNHFPGIYRHGLADVQAVIDARNPVTWGSEWLSLVIHQPKPAGGSVQNLPKNARFPDLGISFFHESWHTPGAAAFFKCGPLGGHTLNEYRDTNNFHYINVAHDDPDANTFVVWDGSGFVAANDRYSHRKASTSHNTILVNNRGQTAFGQAEGQHWSQPTSFPVSMQGMAYQTNWKDRDTIALAEGEAAGSYPATPLTRFRRSFIWNSGKYILVFDDIRADPSASITWLYQNGTLLAGDSANGDFLTRTGNLIHGFQLKSNHPFTSTIGLSTAQDRGVSLELKQLRAVFANVSQLKVACAFRLWDNTLHMTLDTPDADHATITLTGEGFTDVWTWTASPDAQSPGEFVLASSDGQAFTSDKDPWLDAFPGFSHRKGPWTVSNWFDLYIPDLYPWIYHSRLGWLYVAPTAAGAPAGWLWQPGRGWIWTRDDYYPWIFQASPGEWFQADS